MSNKYQCPGCGLYTEQTQCPGCGLYKQNTKRSEMSFFKIAFYKPTVKSLGALVFNSNKFSVPRKGIAGAIKLYFFCVGFEVNWQ